MRRLAVWVLGLTALAVAAMVAAPAEPPRPQAIPHVTRDVASRPRDMASALAVVDQMRP
jgi:hypothetical protein